jgi:circadian clock protein KaiC
MLSNSGIQASIIVVWGGRKSLAPRGFGLRLSLLVPSGAMLETGVTNLDLLLGGGLPEGDVLLVAGPPGSGKTTLAAQVAFHTAANGRSVLYGTTLSEAPPRLLRHIESFSFYDAGQVGKRLFVLDLYPLIRMGLEAVTDALISAVQQHAAALLVVDGLTTLHDLSRTQSKDVQTFVYDLGAAIGPLGCTMILTSSVAERSERSGAEHTLADGIIELGMEPAGAGTVRTIEPRKMRGAAPLLGRHTLRIDADGAAVFPRLEALVAGDDAGLSEKRTPVGLPELDAMMMGGLPTGSVTGLAGALGAGKTLLGLQYVMEGVRRGEKGMIAGFRETPRQLIDKARSFGLDLAEAVAKEQVVFVHRPAVDLLIDEVTDALCTEVERFRPARLMLDSYGDLATAMKPERRRSYMAAFTGFLRSKSVTALLTLETSQLPGPQLDLTDTPVALLAQNFLLLRYLEFRGDFYRIISILKMRDSAFDASVRECDITQDGLVVRPASKSAEGVLRGIARLPYELRLPIRSFGEVNS